MTLRRTCPTQATGSWTPTPSPARFSLLGVPQRALRMGQTHREAFRFHSRVSILVFSAKWLLIRNLRNQIPRSRSIKCHSCIHKQRPSLYSRWCRRRVRCGECWEPQVLAVMYRRESASRPPHGRGLYQRWSKHRLLVGRDILLLAFSSKSQTKAKHAISHHR